MLVSPLSISGLIGTGARHNIAMIYNGLGERDEAFAWLEKAVEDRDVRLSFLRIDPKLDALRADARFARILKRIGL